MVFGGTALQHWGMEGRLTRDIDVQLSKSSANLEGLVPALTPGVQFRDQPRPAQPYVEVMRPRDDFTLPDFSIAEVVEIAPNLKLAIIEELMKGYQRPEDRTRCSPSRSNTGYSHTLRPV
jgi:hypothetical protein